MKQLAFLPFVFLVACGGSAPERKSAVPAAPVAAKTVQVERVQWPSGYEATGTVRARNSVTISSKVVAYVQQVNAELGDRVPEGKLLVTLEVRDIDAAVKSAETAVADVRSAIPEADSGVAAAKASLDLAQSTFRRMQDLASKKSISDQEFDEASARLKAAQAAYDMARGRRTQLDAKLAQAEQAVRSAGVMKDYSRIIAPFAGIITAKSVEPGTLAAPGAPLFTIEREGGYRLEASVDESRLATIRAGQSVEVAMDSIPNHLNCRVAEIVPSVDAASRAATVKIDLPSMAQLRTGMFGRAIFPSAARSVLSIPASALNERGQVQSVFVVEEGTARTRLVTTGERSGDRLEVLSGLNPGEKVISPLPAGLLDGARVEVRP